MSRYRRRQDERGAVLVIFAAFLIVAVLMLAFVIDIGGLREEKKEVTLSTDAAALAVASELDLRTFAAGTYDCAEVPVRGEAYPVARADELAERFLTENGGTLDDGCRVVVTGPRRGYVVIGGQESVDYAFGPVVGQDSGTVSGVSASVARVDAGGGLRPIGVCGFETSINVDPVTREPYSVEEDVLEAARDGDGYLDQPVDMVLAVNHLIRDAACSPIWAPGQRGQLDFDSSGPRNGGMCAGSEPDDGSFTSDYRYGYFDNVLVNTPTDSGNDFRTLADCFVADIEEEQLFWLPIFDRYSPPPGPTVHLVAFAQAQMTAFCLTESINYEVPEDLGCLAEVSGEVPPWRAWLRLTITRVVDFDADGPPLTDDSLLDSPAICAEEDDAVLLEACVPPNPPPLGTPADPTPPPDSPCLVQSVNLSPMSTVNQTGNKLDEDVRVEVTVDDLSDCAEIAVRMRPTRGSGPLADGDMSSNPVIALFPDNSTGFSDDAYVVEVYDDGVLLPYAPPAILTVS